MVELERWENGRKERDDGEKDGSRVTDGENEARD